MGSGRLGCSHSVDPHRHVGHTASDFGLASGGTGEALVSVGRMPVRSIDELRRVVEKTVAWQPSSRLLLVSDDEAEFSGMIERLGAVRDVEGVIDAGAEGARREMLRWLGEGPGTLVYSGHGSLQLLGDEKLLTVEDGQNWQQPSVFVTWSCLCASFAHPTHESLGEALVLAPKGVVAFIGPTGETTSSEQMDMALAVQTALAQGDTIGGALLKGWRAAVTEDSRQGFVLLGDPALRPMPGGAKLPMGRDAKAMRLAGLIPGSSGWRVDSIRHYRWVLAGGGTRVILQRPNRLSPRGRPLLSRR